MSNGVTYYRLEQLRRAEQWLPGVREQVPEVTSADSAFAWMRDHDMYVPRADVRDMWRALETDEGYVAIANRLPYEELVPRAWMSETQFEYGHRYNYIVKLSGQDSITEEYREELVTIVSDESLSVGEVFAMAADDAFRYGLMTEVPSFDVGFDVIKYRPEVGM